MRNDALTTLQKELPTKAAAVTAMLEMFKTDARLNGLQGEIDFVLGEIKPEYLDANKYTAQTDGKVVSLLQFIAVLRNNLKSVMSPITELTHAMHKACTTTTKALVEQLDDERLRNALVKYRNMVAAERDAATKRAIEDGRKEGAIAMVEQQKTEDARVAAERENLHAERAQRVDALIAEGKTMEAEELMAAPITVRSHMIQMLHAPVIVVPPIEAVETTPGVTISKKVKAVVGDMALLIQSIAAHPEHSYLLKIDEAGLARYGLTYGKSGISPIAGIEFIEKSIAVVSSR